MKKVKELTTRQKLIVVVKAKKAFKEMQKPHTPWCGMCNFLSYELYDCSYGKIKVFIPEFEKYKPKSKAYGSYWFPVNNYGYRRRITVFNKLIEELSEKAYKEHVRKNFGVSMCEEVPLEARLHFLDSVRDAFIREVRNPKLYDALDDGGLCYVIRVVFDEDGSIPEIEEVPHTRKKSFYWALHGEKGYEERLKAIREMKKLVIHKLEEEEI